MNLLLLRRDFTDKSTIGLLYVGQVFQCYALEDPDRKLEDGGEKIPGKTAIPRGKYRIIIDWSNRFKRELPRLLDVPNYVGVRIHPGNGPDDTEGCILPGTGIPSTDVINDTIETVTITAVNPLDSAGSVEGDDLLDGGEG